MSDYKTKMHQIVCQLGLSPRPRLGSLQRSLHPQPLHSTPCFKKKHPLILLAISWGIVVRF